MEIEIIGKSPSIDVMAVLAPQLDGMNDSVKTQIAFAVEGMMTEQPHESVNVDVLVSSTIDNIKGGAEPVMSIYIMQQVYSQGWAAVKDKAS